MKKLLLLLTFLGFGLSCQSQVLIALLFGDKLNSDGLEFGLEGGFNFANISNMDSNSYKNFWNLGFYFDIRVKDNWYIYTGCLVKANMGTDNLSQEDLEFLDTSIYNEEGTYSQHMNYFLVPGLIKYKFNNHFYAEAGPQLGLMYRAWVQFNSDEDGREAVIKDFNTSDINWFDAGVAVGVGYHLLKGTGWQVGVRYYWGLTNVYKDRSGTNNRSLHLKVSVPVGTGKSKAKREAELREKIEKEQAEQQAADQDQEIKNPYHLEGFI